MLPRKGSSGGKDPKGLYATLGVQPDADAGDIRKSYRRLALQWHPDKNPDNPSATAEFQKICGAYEVLSDPERRQMYDTTGCIDAEEAAEGDFEHAADLFAAFFSGAGGAFFEDLDADEQTLFDEFVRMTGGAAFCQKGRRKKGRGGRASRARAAAAQQMEDQMLGEMMSAMLGMPGSMEAACPQGHPLKQRKANGGYECDACGSDIVDGRRFFDCRKCDYSMCQKCEKVARAEAEAQELAGGIDMTELVEACCEMHMHPDRQGQRLRFRCDLCNKTVESQEQALIHMEQQHEDEVRALAEDCVGLGSSSAGGFPMPTGGLEEFLMASMQDLHLGEPSAPKGPRRNRKRR